MNKLYSKIFKIFITALPVILMIALIPFIPDDYVLTAAYIGIIIVSLVLKYESKDFIFLLFGFFIMIVSEYFFVSTGVETFVRDSFFGLMPLWLPFLWSYAFVAMKRSINILNS